MPKEEQPPPSRVNVPLQQAIEALLTDRPVAYHPILAHVLGSAIAAILLSQFLYWLPRSRDHEGWFYKDRDEIQAETGLTRDNQETARRVLREASILEERYAGMPKRLYFRIDITELTKSLSGYVQRSGTPSESPVFSGKSQLGAFHPTRRVHSTQQGGGVAPDMSAGLHPAITETPESTPEKQQHGIAVPNAPGMPLPPANGVVVSSQASQGVAHGAANRASRPAPPPGATYTADPIDLGAVENELVKHGVSPLAARHLVKRHPADVLRQKIEMLGDRLRRRLPVEDPGAWLRRAIEENWQPSQRVINAKETADLRRRVQEHRAEEDAMALEHLADRMATPLEERLVALMAGVDRISDTFHKPRLHGPARREREERERRQLNEQTEAFQREHPEAYAAALARLSQPQETAVAEVSVAPSG
jgi:hypothetical protein